MNRTRIAGWAAVAFSVITVGRALMPTRPVNGFDLEAFGRLPVLEGGRIKPIDTVGRNALLMIRSQQTFRALVPGDPKGRKESIEASRWLLDAMFRPEVADAQPAFEIHDPGVLSMLGQPLSSSRYYPFTLVAPHLDDVQKQAMAAQGTDNSSRTNFQRAVINLAERAWLYTKLKATVQLPGAPLAAELQAASSPGAVQDARNLDQMAHFRPIPPLAGARPDDWLTVGRGLQAVAAGQRLPLLEGWARIGQAWAAQDAAAFNAAVGDLARLETAAAPAAVRQGRWEIVFNRAQPFILGIVLYVTALVILFFSWLWKPEVLRPTAFILLVAGTLVHTAGLAARILLQGRPPVTNLYSSAIFVGWVAVILGVVLERIYRRGFGTLVAGAIGVGTLIVAHNLAKDGGDTMEMMRAVLDSNFWLSTHVITITIGYAATFLAGLIAIVWTVLRHIAPLDKGDSKILVSMSYGVICFALFFSFLGTVLGGIWADQSWGRFWGWDPKENGALLIVLWNAIILHARWGGFARERGIMAMAIFGNVITSLSWFGVNMLGVGLHSYGFMDKAFWALFAFIVTQLGLMVLAVIPAPLFRSSSRRAEDSAGASGLPTIR